MRMRLLAPAAAVAVALLAGCTAPEPVPSPTATPRTTPTPTPTPTPEASGPTPRFDLDCSDLQSPADGIFVEAVAPRDPIAMYAGAAGSLPRLSSIQAIGGLVCEWSNGVPQASVSGGAPGHAGLLVSILPAANEQWVRYASTYGIEGTRGFVCPQESVCSGDEIVGEYWLSAEADGVADGAALDAQLAGMATVLGGLPASRPLSTPPATTIPLSSDCTDLISLADVAAVMEIPDDLIPNVGHGGWSQYAAAQEDLGMPSCFWNAGSEENGVGSISGIFGGGSQGLAYTKVVTVPTTAAPLAVEGLRIGDSAWKRCSEKVCYVDLLAGDDWIQFAVLAAADRPALDATTSGLASAIVRTLYSR